MRPPSDPFLRTLYRPLLEDAQAQIRLALKVALLADAGCDPQEIARRTGADARELEDAWRRLERAGHARPL